MMIENGLALTRDICEAFGLVADNVFKLALYVGPGPAVTLNVEMCVMEEQVKTMTTVLKEYELVEKTDANDV